MKKFLSLALAATMVLSMGVPALAVENNHGIELGASDIEDAIATIEQTTGYDADTNPTGTPAELGTLNDDEYYIIDTTGSDATYVARGASSVVVLNAVPTMFKAIVPIALHVEVAADTTKTYPDAMASGTTGTAKIANLCPLGMIKVTDVDVVAESTYTITAWNASYEDMQVNSKNFGFKINGLEVATDGSLTGFAQGTKKITSTLVDSEDGKTDLTRVYADYNFTREDSNTQAFPIIANGSVLPITYEAKLPAFSAAVNNANIGAVVFTLDYHTAA